MIPSRVSRNHTCQYWSIVASCELSRCSAHARARRFAPEAGYC
jgi:hypothetical protein